MCAARGAGVRAHQHGVVLRLAVVGVVALAGLWLKLRGVHRTPATSQGRSVRSVHGRAQAGRHDPPLSNSSLALTRAGPAGFLALREQMQGSASGPSVQQRWWEAGGGEAGSREAASVRHSRPGGGASDQGTVCLMGADGWLRVLTSFEAVVRTARRVSAYCDACERTLQLEGGKCN